MRLREWANIGCLLIWAICRYFLLVCGVFLYLLQAGNNNFRVAGYKMQRLDVAHKLTEEAKFVDRLWGTREPVTIGDSSGYLKHLLPAVDPVSHDPGEPDVYKELRTSWSNSLNVNFTPVFFTRIDWSICKQSCTYSVSDFMNKYFNGSGWYSSDVLDWKSKRRDGLRQAGLSHYEVRSFRDMQSVLSSLSRTRSSPGSHLSLTSLDTGIGSESSSLCSLLLSFPIQAIRGVSLTLHLQESLSEGILAPIQSSLGQVISSTNLVPLQISEDRVTDQDDDARNLKAKFGVFAPFAGFFVGCFSAGWGLWRLRRCANGRQFALGTCALIGGFAFGVISGIVFATVAL
jgi:hypothetical protein